MCGGLTLTRVDTGNCSEASRHADLSCGESDVALRTEITAT